MSAAGVVEIKSDQKIAKKRQIQFKFSFLAQNPLQVLLLWTLWIWHPLGFSTEALAHWGQHFSQPSQVRPHLNSPLPCLFCNIHLSSSSSLDLDVKSPLATEVFNMARYHIPNRCSSLQRLLTMLNSCVRMRLKEQKEALEQMGYKDMARCYHNCFVIHIFCPNIPNSFSINWYLSIQHCT